MTNYRKEIQPTQLLVKLSSLNQFFSLRLVQGRQRDKTLQWGKEKAEFQQDWPSFIIKPHLKLKGTVSLYQLGNCQ